MIILTWRNIVKILLKVAALYLKMSKSEKNDQLLELFERPKYSIK